MKKSYFVLFIFLLFSIRSLNAHENEVLVSVAPHKFFVEKIAGDTLQVRLMVPAGASSHTYEPTPKQIIAASKARLWFCIGESFETRALKALQAYNPGLKAVDMKKGVDMINADPMTGCCCCHANSQDLHIWLSARQAKIQAATIAEALSSRDPSQSELYERNLALFCEEMDALDHEIEQTLKQLNHRMMLVSHPAYAYFCRDYNLTQLSIEFEGKDPTPRQLTRILNQARAAQINKVFIQQQYSSKGARLFAKELNAKVVMLDPYSEEYFDSMRQIASSLCDL